MNKAPLVSPTWKPHAVNVKGRLTAAERGALPVSVFAFGHARKEPMTDTAHVRDAIARFNQVEVVTDSEKDQAFSNIQRAANHFGISMNETDWHQFGAKLPGGGHVR